MPGAEIAYSLRHVRYCDAVLISSPYTVSGTAHRVAPYAVSVLRWRMRLQELEPRLREVLELLMPPVAPYAPLRCVRY